ncbi:MAG: beta-N-acetylhexosaminidase [Bacteroidetes bacterium]|nr:beta-N-acetylhexosaminidase [Bacteroidota bacterium]
MSITGILRHTVGLFCLLIGIAVVASFCYSCKKNSENQPAIPYHFHGIIPLPKSVISSEGYLKIDSTTVIVNNTIFTRAIDLIENTFSDIMRVKIERKDNPGTGANIIFTLDGNLLEEQYQLEIGKQDINIRAGSPRAAFYAAQSLRQMVWNACAGKKVNEIELGCLKIDDQPAFVWRGLHVDLARHMFTKEYLLKVIDWMAYYKLNKLHLHLTDDQGWRIQIDQYPLLTETGAWRDFNSYDSTCLELAKTDPSYTLDERFTREHNGKRQYGGYYSKQDLAEIITYASAHFIEIIPEIDMPGHMSSAIRAYPWLSCTDSTGWGADFSYPICPCNQQTMDFAFNIWDEIIALFPSNLVHIGCDEVETTTWSASPECHAFMLEHNMHSAKEIQNYFVKQLQSHLQSKGKTVIAWDDVIEGTIDNQLLLMYWRDWVTDSPARCAANGNSLIISAAYPFYFSSNNDDQSLEDLYNFKPSDQYNAAVSGKTIGLQGCVWTEIIPSEAKFEQIVFPALQALSEASWSSTQAWQSFQARMKPHFNYMDDQGIHYRTPKWKQ